MYYGGTTPARREPSLTMDEKPQALGVVGRFVGAEEVPLLYVNQFAVSFQSDEFILTVGQVSAPVLLGSPEEQVEQARQLEFVPINVVARFALNRQRFEELTGLLQRQMEFHDRTFEKKGE